MSRGRWAFVLVIYASVVAVAFVFLGGQGVPPCFGTVPTGQVTPECYAAWQATLGNRPLLSRLFDTPWGAVAVFLVLVVGTWVVVRLRAWSATGNASTNR